MKKKIDYYFIGIGGIGMSGLANILFEQGYKIAGSDINKNEETYKLEEKGITINYSHMSKNINNDIQNVVTTAAIRSDNPEILEANRLGINIISRPQLLNKIITQNKAIAITGTHGKTTTTSMISLILEAANLDPTIIVGAEVSNIHGNSKLGKGEYSVAEVCEYQKAFLEIYPYIAIITNIEEDHLDCYKDLEDIVDAFKGFVQNINKKGLLVACGDNINSSRVLKSFAGEKTSYGFNNNNDWRAVNVSAENEKTVFTVTHNDVVISDFSLKVPGEHNVLNALAAIIVAKKIGIDNKTIQATLSSFSGADRRFQILGKYKEATIIDDYAHHPTEIIATLRGARQFYPNLRIIAVFQPHQHCRTKFLLKEFSEAFTDADIVIMPEIYAVRDTREDIESVSSKDVVDMINKITPEKAIFIRDFEQVEDYLEKIIQKDDIILTIGAGPVDKIGKTLLEKSK